ncbi:hypothetical protein WR25_18246 [Diploscapter pachys]|uniref:Dynactin subunit 5 n=1 Tax=Diploscapter pachys TaxID=2018661 RepID=A0A2A2LVI6_9BILA|nr:hypothetical protein WR25_18246 [Diploscapter pachys]
MDLPVIRYVKGTYVETPTGNKVAKPDPGQDSKICGTQNIVLNGKCIIHKEVAMRGDMANIRCGRFCIIGSRTTIRPGNKKFSKGVTLMPVHIGDHVYIEENCVIAAAQIGSYVHIRKNCVIGKSAVLKDCCQVEPDSVVPADAVYPPFSLIAGNPAKVIGHTPECTADLMVEATRDYYDNFIATAVADSSNSSLTADDSHAAERSTVTAK